MQILTKEIDKYKSTFHKGRVISEYIIYIMIDEVIIEAYTELGEENKNNRLRILNNIHGTTN